MVERFPDRTAIVNGDAVVRYTYEEWDEHVDSLTAALADAGVESGDHVGVVMQP